MAFKYLLFIFLFSVNECMSEESSNSRIDILTSSFTDWLQCSTDKQPTECIEGRTVRSLEGVTYGLKKDIYQYVMTAKRAGKQINDDMSGLEPEEANEIIKLKTENEEIIEKIKGRESKPNGLVDEISELFTYGMAKLLGYFSPEKESDEDLTEQIIQQAAGRSDVEARGHKKKYLKKQNKHLKIILLLMLFKNKVKMFMHKVQVLLQLKFLGIAVINLLVNLVRLWLDLKKHHKPHKVVYYENAHHQHHYDHEHLHDHDEGYYSHPGSHSHHSHHEEEYSGGPWPWSRSYIEKQSEQAFQTLNSQPKVQQQTPHNLAYLKQRPVR